MEVIQKVEVRRYKNLLDEVKNKAGQVKFKENIAGKVKLKHSPDVKFKEFSLTKQKKLELERIMSELGKLMLKNQIKKILKKNPEN